MTKCGACKEPATVGVKWGSQGQSEPLCNTHAQEVNDRLSGAVAKLETPSPTFVPIEVWLKTKAALRDDRAAMRDIG